VVTHTTVAERDRHPQYQAAKSGDGQAAAVLARDLVAEHALALLLQIIGRRSPLIAPVSALETNGFIALPDALAQVIGERTGWPQDDGELLQRNLGNACQYARLY
jgi:hypothetical protein